MKNIAIVICLLVGVSGISQSSVGVETGVSFSKFRGDAGIENGKGLVTFVPGIFYEYKFSESLAIKAAFSYQEKGSTFDGQLDISDPGDPIFNQDDIDIQISSKFYVINPLLKFRTKGETKFFANAGPFLGLSSTSGGPSDYGFTTGVGLERSIKKLTLSIEARNSLGLADLNRDSLLDGYFKKKSNAYYLLLGAAYSF